METANLIPAPLTGEKFLASSHLKIGYDDRFSSRKSTFHKDYIPTSSICKPDAAKPPLPSTFMHKDANKISQRVSETRQEFQKKECVFSGDHRDKYSALYKTNFKPDRDDRIKNFSTTHDCYYTPKPTSAPPDNSKLSRVWAKSSFPQGDKEKADEPESTYRGGYRGHDTSKIKIKRMEGQHWGGDPTIKGDNSRRFLTTHDSTFTGHWTDPCGPMPKQTISSIPEGDKEKVIENVSTMRNSFQKIPLDYEPHSSEKAYGKLYATNFKLTDGHGRFDKYTSTAKESYIPLNNKNTFEKRLRDRNASDIPEGDMDVVRSIKRINTTTTRGHLRNITTNPVEHVDGSKLRTRSNVLFGEPRLAGRFYDSTCDSTYFSHNVPYKKAQTYYPSIVPLDYYGNQQNSSTTCSDFQNPKIGRLQINEEVLGNLRKTHFTPPLGKERYFSTTHDSHYTPKTTPTYEIDQNLLQRSSVPFGTLGKHIKGCHEGWDLTGIN